MQDEDAGGGGGGEALAGVEEHQLGVAGLHDEGGIGLRGATLARRQVTQHQAAESAFQDSNQPPHRGRIP